MATNSYSNPASRNTAAAAEIPGKIAPAGKDKMGAGGDMSPPGRAKNVSMGKDSGSSLSVKPGMV